MKRLATVTLAALLLGPATANAQTVGHGAIRLNCASVISMLLMTLHFSG